MQEITNKNVHVKELINKFGELIADVSVAKPLFYLSFFPCNCVISLDKILSFCSSVPHLMR